MGFRASQDSVETGKLTEGKPNILGRSIFLSFVIASPTTLYRLFYKTITI